jgi:hypothetical protein
MGWNAFPFKRVPPLTVPSLRVALEAQLNRLDVLMGAQPGTYAEELSKPGTILQFRRLAAPTSLSMSYAGDPTLSRPSVGLPHDAVETERPGKRNFRVVIRDRNAD